MNRYLQEALRIARGIEDAHKRMGAIDEIATVLAMTDPVATRELIKEIDLDISPTSWSSIAILLYGLHRQPQDKMAADLLIRLLASRDPKAADQQASWLKSILRTTPNEFRQRYELPNAEQNEKMLKRSQGREQDLRSKNAPDILLFREVCLQIARGDEGSLARAQPLASTNPEELQLIELSLLKGHAIRRQLREADRQLANIHEPKMRVEALCELARLTIALGSDLN